MSAYALFFRDTQANIKAQNPNATFGEVSKIVASMWDGLGEEQKQVGAVTPTLILKLILTIANSELINQKSIFTFSKTQLSEFS